jgi:5-hydroxyisourate hydrolase
MAILSSHFLNAVDGTHAGQVGVSLFLIKDDASRQIIFTEASDGGGRFSKEFDAVIGGSYELVIASATYFNQFDMPKNGMHILDEIVIRFAIPDADAKYHIPIIMSPNSYSCWWSS